MSWLDDLASQRENELKITGQTEGHFGLATTGVYSRADLEANSSGLKFYSDLLTNPQMKFDINNYVKPIWNDWKYYRLCKSVESE
jgi:hypothetical protein